MDFELPGGRETTLGAPTFWTARPSCPGSSVPGRPAGKGWGWGRGQVAAEGGDRPRAARIRGRALRAARAGISEEEARRADGPWGSRGKAGGRAARWSRLRTRGSGTRPCTATWTASFGVSRTSPADSWEAARSSATGTVPPQAGWPCALGLRASPGAPSGVPRARTRHRPPTLCRWWALLRRGAGTVDGRGPHRPAGRVASACRLPPTRRVKGWARRRRRGDFLRVVAGRFGAVSRPQLFECPPFVSHSGWWEKRQKIRDGVGVDGDQGHCATGYATGAPGAPDQVRRKRARQLRLWMVSAWKRGTFIGTGMDWPCAGHIWASGVGRTPRGPVLGSKGCSSPQGHLMPGQV